MASRESTPTAPAGLPDEIVDRLNALERPALRALQGYVEQQLATRRPSIAEQIATEADGEIIDIEDCGAYTLVRKRPPSQDDSGGGSRPIHVYRVRRVNQLNGTDTLHWSFVGETQESMQAEGQRNGSDQPPRTDS